MEPTPIEQIILNQQSQTADQLVQVSEILKAVERGNALVAQLVATIAPPIPASDPDPRPEAEPEPTPDPEPEVPEEPEPEESQ